MNPLDTAVARRADHDQLVPDARRRAHARRRRPRRADAPVQGAAAEALLRHASAPSCSTASASCPSTTRRAPSARSSSPSPRGSRRPRARRRSSSSGRAPRRRRACCSARSPPPGRCERYVPVDVTEAMVVRVADELTTTFDGLEVHGIVGDFERHLEHVPAAERRPADRRVPRRHDRQLHAGRPAALPALARAAAAPGDRPPAARDRPREGSRDPRGRLQRRRRRHRGVQPQRPARPQPRARRRLRRRGVRARRVLRPPARVDRDAPAREPADDRDDRRPRTSASSSRRARSCGRRSARSSRPRAWPATLRPPA